MTGSILSAMEKFDIDTVRSIVKTILVMYPDGVTRDELLEEYKKIAGDDLPYRNLGYSSLMAFINTVSCVGYTYVNGGRLLYVLASSEQKGRTPVSKPVKEENKTSRLKLRARRKLSERRLANRVRRNGHRQTVKQERPTATGYDFSESVQRPETARENNGPARYVYSWTRPLRDAGLLGDFTENSIPGSINSPGTSDQVLYTFRYSDSLVPKTERHLYDGDDRLDHVDRPSMKRRFDDDDDVPYDQFCSEYATSRKRIRLDADHPVWCGPTNDPVFGYRQRKFVYTPRQHSDIVTYKRLVREDATKAHTRVCRFFVTTMDCDKGDMCWFLHVPGHQLTMPDRDRFKLPRRQCCYYLATGCPWEDRCTRLHVSNHDITPEDRHRLRLPQMRTCRYHTAKECIFGDTCEWNHVKEEKESRDVPHHMSDHVMNPEKKMLDKMMDDFDFDCLEDVVKIEHFDTRV